MRELDMLVAITNVELSIPLSGSLADMFRSQQAMRASAM
jgi:hypothetical protein